MGKVIVICLLDYFDIWICLFFIVMLIFVVRIFQCIDDMGNRNCCYFVIISGFVGMFGNCCRYFWQYVVNMCWVVIVGVMIREIKIVVWCINLF